MLGSARLAPHWHGRAGLNVSLSETLYPAAVDSIPPAVSALMRYMDRTWRNLATSLATFAIDR